MPADRARSAATEQPHGPRAGGGRACGEHTGAQARGESPVGLLQIVGRGGVDERHGIVRIQRLG